MFSRTSINSNQLLYKFVGLWVFKKTLMVLVDCSYPDGNSADKTNDFILYIVV